MTTSFFRKASLASAIALASMGATLPLTAAELQFDNPNITGRLDTALSAGALFRVSSRDRKLAAIDDAVYMADHGYSTQLNKNDANNNFDPGLASMVYKITPELELNFGYTWGIFARATAFYDSVIMDRGHDGGVFIPRTGAALGDGLTRWAEPGSTYNNNGYGSRFGDEARSLMGRRGRMLDAYVFGNFDVADRPLNVRLGQQVITWGEAVFTQNGVNTANYMDLAALRMPGAELKEALLPLDSFFFSFGLTDTLSLEAFYQFEWENSEDAPAGTYFSTHDAFPGKGANAVVVDGRLVAHKQGVPAVADAFAQYTLNTYGQQGVDYAYEQTQVTIKRIADIQAKDDGQFGAALRWDSSLFGGTEFGFYYSRTHARLPVVAAYIGSGSSIPESIDKSRYAMAYLEDIDMFGASFSTSVGELALSGELAYRPKQPIINEVGDNLVTNLATAAAAGNSATLDLITDHCIRDRVGGSCLSGATNVEAGKMYYFYDEAETVTGSLVGIYSFGPRFGTDNLMAIVELGVDYTGGLNNNLRYNSTAAIEDGEALIQSPNDPDRYYLTEMAWGYKAILAADFNNVFAGVNLKPNLVISHDVQGNSPIGGNFMEDRKAATLGFNFIYNHNLEVSLQGTSFWGNGYANKLSDRDNASVTVKYAF